MVTKRELQKIKDRDGYKKSGIKSGYKISGVQASAE